SRNACRLARPNSVTAMRVRVSSFTCWKARPCWRWKARRMCCAPVRVCTSRPVPRIRCAMTVVPTLDFWLCRRRKAMATVLLWLPLERHEIAAIHRDVGAGDETGVVGGEEGDGAGDFERFAQAADRNLGDDLGADVFGYFHDHLGLAVAGRHAVDGDALLRDFAGQRHREAVHAGLGRGIVGLAELAGLA